MLIRPGQNKRLHQLLNELHIADMKGELVYNYTDGRTTHSSDMLISEANELIKSLEKNDKGYDEFDKLRKKVISEMIEMWAVDDKGKADMHFIYWFSLNFIHKKKFNSLKQDELSSMISIIQHKWLPWFFNERAKRPDFTIKSIKNEHIRPTNS